MFKPGLTISLLVWNGHGDTAVSVLEHQALVRNSLHPEQVQKGQSESKACKTQALPTQNFDRNSASENFSTQKNSDDNSTCRQIMDSDPAIRVAAFIEGAEVTGYAETARTKNVLSQSSDLRKQVGFWVSIVTEMARQTDKMFGNTEWICFTHKGLKMVSVPLSARRSLGLSLDRSADPDKIILKIMAKFDLRSAD